MTLFLFENVANTPILFDVTTLRDERQPLDELGWVWYMIFQVKDVLDKSYKHSRLGKWCIRPNPIYSKSYQASSGRGVLDDNYSTILDSYPGLIFLLSLLG